MTDHMDNSACGDVGAYIASIMESPKLAPQIAHHRLIPGAPPEYGQSRLPWSTAMSNLMSKNGINLYAHQALAMDHIRAGHSIIASTPTASGKSLIYNFPVYEKFLRDPDATSLYLFPLKALAQDQLAAFDRLGESWPKDGRPKAAIYDGDTSDYTRRKIRNNPPTVLLTNPEMLNQSILPYHQSWATFLANLSHIVVDEAHTYRGVFGSHMAQVFRRLNRIAGHYGASPAYVFCTATLGNPLELAGNLMGREEKLYLINKSGAPQGPRHFLFFNPEQAASTCAIELLKTALARNLRTIVYCQSRRMTELISIWAGAPEGEWRGRISAYRAGFLPGERRNIEARMASGELRAVISTSALELGIDIGGLDVCILVGYPGTIMQTLQRGGRVGRSARESAVLIVAGEDALDQYFVRNPGDFFSREPENAVVNPDNPVILARHLECAAAEKPLAASEKWLSAPGAREAIRSLRAQGLLLPSADGMSWLAARKRPQRGLDLRGCGQAYAIEEETGQVIGTVDGFRVWKETHPGAVYIHNGKSYVVVEVDSGRMRVLVKKAKVSWFTRTRGNKETEILEEYERKAVGRCAVFRGRLRITENLTGYEKRAAEGNRLLSVVPLEAPPYVFETEGIWLAVPDNIRESLENRFLHFMASIHALEHAMIGLLPLEVMADRNDFGGISIPIHAQLGLGAVFVYDGLPGGAGLTASAFPRMMNLLESVKKAISGCPCEDGCPSCIHSPKCGAGNRPLSKTGVLALLDELLEQGNEGKDICENLVISAPAGNSTEILSAQNMGMEDGGRQNCAGAGIEARAEENDALWMPPGHFVVFDVETRRSSTEVGGWQNAAKMGVSVAVLYDSREDCFFTYEQDELAQMFARMAAADAVIGFNSVRFDYRVLAPFNVEAGEINGKPFNLVELPRVDLLQKIEERLGYRVSLDNLGKTTLGAPKTADGLQALNWWKKGMIGEIAAYCRKDVEITRDLYLYGLREKHLFFSNKAGKKAIVPVDFRLESQK